MKNLKVLNQEKTNLKERNKMKKLLSSVLVVTLMGVPTVSGVFADSNKEKRVEDIMSLMEKASSRGETETFNSLEKILNDILDEDENRNKNEINVQDNKVQDEKVEPKNEEIKIEDKKENEKSNDVKVQDEKQAKTSTTKKILIGTAVIALTAAGGYVIYNYCPAVKEFVDPYAREMYQYASVAGNKVKDFGISAGSKVKNFGVSTKEFATKNVGLTINFAKTTASVAKDFVVRHANSVANVAKSSASATKDFVVRNANSVASVAKSSASATKNFVVRHANSAFNTVKSWIPTQLFLS